MTTPKNIQGAGMSGTVLKNIFPRVRLNPSATYRDTFRIQDMAIGNPGVAGTFISGAIGILATGCWNLRLTNVRTNWLTTGIEINAPTISGYAYGTRIEKCVLYANRYGVRLNGD